MKTKNVLIILTFVIMFFGILTTNSSAATFDLDVYFDGKTITMNSEDESIGLNALNLLPGETDNSIINITNKGSQKVTLFVLAKVVDDNDLLEVLNIVIKDSNGTQLYSGNYNEFEKIEISLAKGAKETLNIQTSMPNEAGNEYQNKEANIKFTFEANGKEIKIENPKTNQSKTIIYIVLLTIVAGLVITLITLTVNKKKNN